SKSVCPNRPALLHSVVASLVNLSMQKKTFFGALEQPVMNALWQDGPATVRDVVRRLGRKASAYTTVMTVMNRLVSQGFLRRRMTPSGAYRYEPTQSEDAFEARATQRGIQSLVQRYGDVALVQFIETLDQV